MPLAILAWAAFLGAFHALSTGVGVMTQHGTGYSNSPRDEERPLSPGRARNNRAYANFLQTFPIFAAAVLISHAVHRDHGVASWGAQFYFWARIVYVPLYVTGSKYRTYAFIVSFVGILLVFRSVA